MNHHLCPRLEGAQLTCVFAKGNDIEPFVCLGDRRSVFYSTSGNAAP